MKPLKKPDMKGQRLVALFCLGCLLFSYPLISLFDSSGAVLGIPVLYAYLFAVWTLFIGLAAIVVATSH